MVQQRSSWNWLVVGAIVVGLMCILTLALVFGRWLTLTRPRPLFVHPPEVAFESSGAAIYYTGYNQEGEAIPFTEGPRWLLVHGGGCAECHGPTGEGGRLMMMTLKLAPNIQYEYLTEETAREADEEPLPYTDLLLKRAITEGLDPAGEPLDPLMPRWHATEIELDDLVEFLKMLDTGEHETLRISESIQAFR